MNFLKIDWAPDEILFEIWGFGIHVYSLMFVIAFSLGYYILKGIYAREKVDVEYIESIFVYTVLSTLIGARLGEVFFYSWDYYQDNLVEVLLPIRHSAGNELLFGIIDGYRFTGFRGLASHGAVIGIVFGLFLYQRKYKYKSLLWILDRLTIPVSIGGAFVRIGNFFNSEIVGKYTNSDFGIVFLNNGDRLPRHPAQLYEAFGYILLFILLRKVYATEKKELEGFLLGVLFIGMFSIRFIIEFVKESQGGFEEFLPGLSTGQWLSIPIIISGVILTRVAKRRSFY